MNCNLATTTKCDLDQRSAVHIGRIGCNRLKGLILFGFYGARRIVHFYFRRYDRCDQLTHLAMEKSSMFWATGLHCRRLEAV